MNIGPIEIRDGRVADLDVLNALILRSKASWGYDHEFMDACRAELTVTAADLASATVRIAIDDDRMLGMSAVVIDGEASELTMLFVEPDAMQRGVGRVLLADAVAIAGAAGANSLRIEADPNAVAFYERAGAVRVGEVPSGSIPGRVLPLLELHIP